MARRVVTKNPSMAQIELHSGERVMVSFTQTEVAVFRLAFFGFIPIRKLWSRPFGKGYVEAYWVRSPSPIDKAIEDIIYYPTITELQTQFLDKN